MPRKIVAILLFLFFVQKNWANTSVISFSHKYISIDSTASVCEFSENHLIRCQLERPSPSLRLFRAKQKNSKKVIATALAFPLPFGIVGLHRIYLGSAPYVPVVYIASLGGVFGILPFIDFCVLLASKKTDPYTNNEKIFMWVN